MTISDSLGEVTTIMMSAPMPSKVLRRAMEAVAPTADLICVVSAVRRDTISPECGGIEKVDAEAGDVCKNISSNISNDPLAQPDNKIITAGARYRQNDGDDDEHGKVAVDELCIAAGEPEIDHAPDCDWQGQGGCGSQDQKEQGRNQPAAIAKQVREQF